jgi:Putative zinc-finger
VNSPSQCAQIRPELGVYVLGAIAPADRAVVNRHLASCPRCREEVAELAGLPAQLRKVPVADAMQLSGERQPDHSGPPEALVDGLVGRTGTVRRRRRRRRWSLAAAAAVLAAVAAVGWAVQVSQAAAPPHRAAVSWWTASAEGYDAATGVSAAVRYTPKPWGTELKASVSDIRPGTPCQIWATTVSGQQAAAGGWTVTRSDPRAWYPASVPFPAASLASFRITAHGNILVTISLHPGTQPTPAHSSSGPG